MNYIELYNLLHSIREKWSAVSRRYERAGSDWHLRMPGDWPAEVVMTVDELRRLATWIPARSISHHDDSADPYRDPWREDHDLGPDGMPLKPGT